MKRKNFVFNVSWQEVLMEYPAEVRLEVYDAVIRYAASGTLSELKPLSKMAFSFIKNEIDYNQQKYDETVSKKSEAGKKGGGNPNFKKGTPNPYYDNKDKQTLTDINKHKQDKQTLTDINLYVNDNVIGDVNVSKENAFGVKEKPETAAEQEPEIPEGSFPGTGQEECESFPVEAGNLPKKENSGGAAQNPGCGGVFPGGTVKPPGGARNPRSAAENAKICRESPSWLDAVSMLHGMTVEEVKAELDQFQTHLISNGRDEPKTLSDFKAHFNNLLRRREENANNRANHAGARPGAGAKTAGGVGSGAERPRPKPLFPIQPSGQGRGGA